MYLSSCLSFTSGNACTQALNASAEASAARLGYNGGCVQSCCAHTLSTKAQDTATSQPEAPEASGSSTEQQAEADKQVPNPAEQLLAEKEQQVVHRQL